MKRKWLYLAAFGVAKKVVLAVVFFAPSLGFSEQGVEVIEAWARATVPGARAGAAYVTLVNNAEKDDALVAVSTEIARSSQIHKTEDNDGIMSMEHIDALPLPSGVEVGMSPGGYHIMFMGLNQGLEAGLEIPLSLTFKNAPTRHVRVAIKPLTYQVKNDDNSE